VVAIGADRRLPPGSEGVLGVAVLDVAVLDVAVLDVVDGATVPTLVALAR
jgi:hypothetical protein